jgi:hypothetical protein
MIGERASIPLMFDALVSGMRVGFFTSREESDELDW